MPSGQQEAGTVSAEQAMLLLLLDKPSDLKRLEREGVIKPTSSGRYWLKDLVQDYVRHLRRDAPVSVAEMGRHLDCAPAYVRKLVDQGVIERRTDAKFDLDQCRTKYLAHLRSERQHSPKSAADVEFTSAKAELIRIRIAEKQRTTITLEDAIAREDKLVGMFITAMSSLPAQCAVGDRHVQRRLEQWVLKTRTAIAADINVLADAEEQEVKNGTDTEVHSMPAKERVAAV